MHGFRKANPYVGHSVADVRPISYWFLIFFSTGFKSKSETAELSRSRFISLEAYQVSGLSAGSDLRLQDLLAGSAAGSDLALVG